MAAAAPNTSDRVVMKVRGMMCGSCSLAVKRALHSLPGIGTVTVDLPRDLVTVSYDRTRATVPQMVEVIRKAGYRAEPPP
jgi:Cu+-exporting ATPase